MKDSGEQHSRKLILLDEDDAIIAMDEAFLLENNGYRVIIANSGEEALELFRRGETADLVLMDVDLGEGMDGTEAAKRILADRTIPVVFLSSHTEREVVQKTEGITSYGYVVKHSGETVLMASIRMAFRLYEANLLLTEKTTELEAAFEELAATNEELQHSNEELRLSQEEIMKRDADLRESEMKYRTLVENANEGILIAQDGNFLFANRRLSAMVGVPAEMLVGKPIADYIHADDREHVMAQHALRLQGRDVPDGYGFRVISAGGKNVWVRVSAALITWSGNPATINLLTDITERRFAEERFRIIFEGSNDCLATLNPPSWKFSSCNQATLELFRMKEQEDFTGLHPADLSPDIQEDGRPTSVCAVEMIQAALKHGSHLFEWMHTRINGEIFPASVLLTRLEDATGMFLIANIRDVTSEKLARDLLMASRRELESIIEFLPDPTFVIDNERRVVIWNRAMEEMTGIDGVEMIGKAGYAYSAPFYGIQRPQLIDLVLGGDSSTESLYHSIRREGGAITGESFCPALHGNSGGWVYAKASPLRDRQGNVNGAIEIIRDITETRAAVTALKERETELTHMLKSMINAFAIFDSVFDGKGDFVSYRFVYINDAYERITGVRNDEVRGRTVYEVWPGTEQGWIDAYGSVAITGVPRSFEMYHRPTSKLYYCNVYRPWSSRDRFCVIFEDITERKKAEREILAIKTRLEGILNAIPDLMFEVDREGFYRSVYSKRMDLLLVPPEQLIGKSLREVLPPDVYDVARAALNEAFGTGFSHGRQYRLDLPHGPFWFELSIARMTEVPGQDPRCICLSRDITARKQTGEALIKSENQYRKLFENAPVGIFRTNSRGEVLEVNNTMARILGLASAEDALRFYHNLGEQLYVNAVRRDEFLQLLKKERSVENFEYDARSADGRIVTLSMNARVEAVGDDGSFIIEGFTSDITAKKRAEEALAESENLSQSILNSVQHPIFGVEYRRIIFANAAMEKLFGWKRDEFIGKSTRILFRNDDEWREYGERLYSGLQRQKFVVFESDIPFVTGDGKLLLCRNTVSWIGDDPGPGMKIVAIFEDITDQKRSDEMWKFALEGAGDGVWDWNAKTNRVYYSGQWKAMLGYEDGDIGDTLSEWERLLHPEDRDHVFRDIERHFSGELPVYTSEHRLRCKDGTYKWILDRGKVIQRDNEGRPLRAIGTHADISRIKKSEVKLALALDENKALLRELQHRIKNTLGIITSLAGIESGADVDPSVKTALENIKGRMRALSNLYSLLYSSGDVKDVSLDGYIRSVADTVVSAFSAPASGMNMGFDLEAMTINVKKATSFGLILNEFLTNAFKHAFSGGGHIIIRVKLERSGGSIVLSVSNSGKGLSENFDPEKTEGFGLKLASMLARQHGGNVEFARGELTVFTARMPES
jgi:PAS domain S-box-containing protein